jgi:hypothetical protein
MFTHTNLFEVCLLRSQQLDLGLERVILGLLLLELGLLRPELGEKWETKQLS